MPENKIREYFKQMRRRSFTVEDITELKRGLKVSHEVLLKRLNALKLCDMLKEDYLEELKLYYAGLENKIPFQNSEPEPLPLSDRGEDFFDCAILAAYKKNLISEEEAMKHLRCTVDGLQTKRSNNARRISMILEGAS